MKTSQAWCRRIVLAEPAADAALAPLLRTRSFAELPWADTLLIDAQLKAAADAGVVEVDLVVRQASKALRARLDDGKAWGIALRVHEHARPCLYLDDSRELRSRFPGADASVSLSLSPEDLNAWLQEEHPVRWDSVYGDAVLARRADLSARIAASLAAVRSDRMRSIDSPRRLYDGNLQRLRSMDAGHSALRRVDESLMASKESVLPSLQRFGGRNLVADGVFVHPEVSSIQDSILGSGSRVAARSSLNRCLLLPGSAVGEGLHLQDMIVDGPRLIDIETGLCVILDDPMLLPATSEERPVVPVRERLVALGVLILAGLPVLAAAGLLRLAGRGGMNRVYRSVPAGRSLRGETLWNRTGLWTVGAADAGAWRRLLWSLAVVRGDLRLRGELPPEEASAEIDGVVFGMFAVGGRAADASEPGSQPRAEPHSDPRVRVPDMARVER